MGCTLIESAAGRGPPSAKLTSTTSTAFASRVRRTRKSSRQWPTLDRRHAVGEASREAYERYLKQQKRCRR